MTQPRVTKQAINTAAQAVEDLLTYGRPVTPRTKARTALAKEIAELAAHGRPSEKQIDDLRARFPAVEVHRLGDPHKDVLAVGPGEQDAKAFSYGERLARFRRRGERAARAKKARSSSVRGTETSSAHQKASRDEDQD